MHLERERHRAAKSCLLTLCLSLGAWLLGVLALALYQGESPSYADVYGTHGLPYYDYTKTWSAYQDPSGKYTIYIRQAQSVEPDVPISH